jgi:hypothetical protein
MSVVWRFPFDELPTNCVSNQKERHMHRSKVKLMGACCMDSDFGWEQVELLVVSRIIELSTECSNSGQISRVLITAASFYEISIAIIFWTENGFYGIVYHSFQPSEDEFDGARVSKSDQQSGEMNVRMWRMLSHLKTSTNVWLQ